MDVATAPEPAAILAALETEAAEFERELEELSEAELARPSFCEGWTNAEVVAHLTWAGGFFQDQLERGLRGDASPPRNLPPQGPERRRRIAEVAREVRRELGGSLLPAFHEANRSLHTALARVGPDQWDLPTAHRTGSIRRLAQTRLNELAVHGWDIQSILRPPAHLRESSLPVLFDLLGRWLELLHNPDLAQESTWRLRFDYPTGPIAPRDLVVSPGRIEFVPAADEPADLVLHAHPEVTLLLAMGRLDPEQAAVSYGLTTTGRAELLSLFRSRFGLI